MRLIFSFALQKTPSSLPRYPIQLSTRIVEVCLWRFYCHLFPVFAILLLAGVKAAFGQAPVHPLKADLPAQDEILLRAVTQDSNGPMRYLRGEAKVITSEMQISADEIDFNSDTNVAYARGHLHLDNFNTADKLNADHGEYNIRTQEGKFYSVNGTSPAKIMTSPGVLTSTNPFYFQALWAERIKDRFILHHGFITDCKIPKPWWIFQAPVFDIIPGDRAIGKRDVFRLKRVPILYLPYFYRPLGTNPRQSGFLTPTAGNSSFYGYMVGGGYYWAMNPSYDMTGRVQYFTQRGPAFSYDFRGKPNRTTDFNYTLYDVDDMGGPNGNGTGPKEGGLEFELIGRTQIAGFTGRIDYNYLSTFLFRQAFSYSFATAILNEVNSVGFLQRRFKRDEFTLTFAGQRDQIYQTATLLGQTQNEVVLQKLPSVELSARDREVASGLLPVWVSLNASASLLDRQEPGTETFGSPPFIRGTGAYSRLDVEPHVATSFAFKHLTLTPGLTVGLTDYSNSYSSNSTQYTAQSSCGGYPSCPPISTYTDSRGNPTVVFANSNLLRKDADFTLDLRTPTLERVYVPPKRLHLGTKVKHVIEGEAKYEYVTGIDRFQQVIRFDQTDILSNTNQLTLNIVNRLYKKDKTGTVSEFATWRISQQRYFDPTFGGAVLNGVRSVVLSAEDFTPYTFLDGPRNYSPVSSMLTVNPFALLSLDWRTDYDPLRQKVVDQSYGVSTRYKTYFAGITETAIGTNPLLVPQANQFGVSGGYGNTNRKGWNVAGSITRDLLLQRTIFQFVQTSYNTDCCGFSFEYRHFNFGIRNENQYLFSFSVANIGTFGSLQKQERIF